MSLSRRLAALVLPALVLATAVLTAAPAQATGDPVRVDVRGAGARWTAATVDIPQGERVTSSFRLLGPTSPAVVSGRTYLDGDPLSAFTFVLRSAGGERGVAVHAPVVQGISVDLDTTEPQRGSGYAAVDLEVVVNPDGPVRRGRLSVVVYGAAPEVNGWEWKLSAAQGAVVRGTSDGAGTFVATSRDFTNSELSVYAGHTVPDVGTVTARVQRRAEFRRFLDQGFMGSFNTFGTDTLRITGPAGLDRDCSGGCNVDPATSTRLPGAGEYRFRLDGTAVGVSGTPLTVVDSDVTLHGALVRAPLGRL